MTATLNTGLRFGIGDLREFDGVSVKVPTQRDWVASLGNLPDNLNNRKATSFDTQVVCLQYFNGQGGTLDSCLVPGSPYMTLKYTNAEIILISDGGPVTEFQWVNPGNF